MLGLHKLCALKPVRYGPDSGQVQLHNVVIDDLKQTQEIHSEIEFEWIRQVGKVAILI